MSSVWTYFIISEKDPRGGEKHTRRVCEDCARRYCALRCKDQYLDAGIKQRTRENIRGFSSCSLRLRAVVSPQVCVLDLRK